MAYTNVFPTVIAQEVAKQLSVALRGSCSFLNSIQKVIVPKGQSTVSIIKPGTITSSTRVEGGALAQTGSVPTDTTVSLTPSSEYYAMLPIDRLSQSRSAVDLAALYGPQLSAKIIEAINTALWAKITTDVTTNIVGDTSNAAGMVLLAQAWSKLFSAKCTMTGLVACIGGPEAQAWLPDATYNNAGPLGQPALEDGNIGKRYGFMIKPDQSRYYSAGVQSSVAFNPMAFAVGFRSETVPTQGSAFGQATDPTSGLTVFTSVDGMNNSTNGVGNSVTAWVVADVKTVMESWACLIQGVATA